MLLIQIVVELLSKLKTILGFVLLCGWFSYSLSLVLQLWWRVCPFATIEAIKFLLLLIMSIRSTHALIALPHILVHFFLFLLACPLIFVIIHAVEFHQSFLRILVKVHFLRKKASSFLLEPHHFESGVRVSTLGHWWPETNWTHGVMLSFKLRVRQLWLCCRGANSWRQSMQISKQSVILISAPLNHLLALFILIRMLLQRLVIHPQVVPSQFIWAWVKRFSPLIIAWIVY